MDWRGQAVPVGAVRGLEGHYKFLNSHRLHSSGPASAVSYTATPGFSQNTHKHVSGTSSQSQSKENAQNKDNCFELCNINNYVLCSWPANATSPKNKKPKDGWKPSSVLNSLRVKNTKMSLRTELFFAN